MRELDEGTWVREQTNTAMTDNNQVNIAKLFAAVHQLPLHPDRWKNWDSFIGIHHVNRLCERDTPILDAGACRDPNSPSAFLPSLTKLGFTNLHGCNLDETIDVVENGALYSHQNIEKTSYPDGHFGFIACLSTIEHGVDWRKYFQEMARLLRVHGFLFTSFDYWQNPIDTKGQRAFGAPIKIFTETEVMQMAIYAKSCGLSLVKRPTLKCRDRPVEWMGMSYTFMNLLMRKDDAEEGSLVQS
jgi:SAM-dependent methyltransferase